MSKSKETTLNIDEILDKLFPTTSEEMKEGLAQADRMLEFSDKIVDDIAEFVGATSEQRGWPISLMIGIARATSIAIRVLEKSSNNPDANLMQYYIHRILPLCDMVTQKREMDNIIDEVMNNQDIN